ncbi:MAG: type II CRISPR-associated endonuclease Cas1 [Planctomycetaceae bacterium]
MRNRIVDIAERPARLRIERRQLVIETEPEPARIPLEDFAVVVVSHPQVSFTQAVLSELAAAGGVFVTCDRRRMPVGLMLPLAAHSVQTERFRKQLELTRPKQKRLWQQLVRAKIVMQAAVLREQTGDECGLRALLPAVRSGDPSNIEARAARRYWTALFGSDFRRDRDAGDHNRLLNYGYAVLRAATARAICAAGLHPSVGLHHHNRYNAWCLADDLMEPFRPLVDRAVAQFMDGRDDVPALDGEARVELLEVLTGTVDIAGEQRSLFDALARTAGSLANVVTGEADALDLPTGTIDAAA